MILSKRCLILFITSVIIGFTHIAIKEVIYEKISNLHMDSFIGIVVSDKKEKEYTNLYEISCKNKQLKNNKFLLYTDKETTLNFGDEIKFNGELQKVNEERNYKGFNYKVYLKSKNIYGVIKAERVKVIGKDKVNAIYRLSNRIKERIKLNIKSNLPEETANLLLALTIGEKDELDEGTIKEFRLSNLAHILAISGMHISYIILGINLIVDKLKVPKNRANFLIILILIMFIFITGFSPSVIRGSIMGIILLISKSLHLKFDFWTAISISLLFIIFNNPFAIFDRGLELSYIGTISIVVFSKMISTIKIIKDSKVGGIIIASISAQILLLPITILFFNSFSLYFLISNILCAPLVGAIIIFGFLIIIFSILFSLHLSFFYNVLNILLTVLKWIPKTINKLPFSNFYICTPNYLTIVLYYIIVALIYILISLNNKVINGSKVRKYEKKMLKNRIIQKIILVIIILTIIINLISNIIFLLKKEIVVHFVDVGQGDCTLIVTPNKKNILIDGGEDKRDILLPYLLDRKIIKLDYIIISHFDNDHCGALISIMQELKVNNIIIGKQYEKSENYINFLKIAKSKKIRIYVVEAGQKINIEKNLGLEILWPDSKSIISENVINNNSLIFKLIYKNFSILFTGDIEEVAEKRILELYSNNIKTLGSAILKVAHHGSATSSTVEFLNAIKPKIALIGVGENNKFGHPSKSTIENLNKINCKIYRTDKNGEITIKSNGSNINIKKHIK